MESGVVLTLWHVMPAVGFTRNIEWIRLPFGKSVEKLNDELERIRRHFGITDRVVAVFFRITKADPCGLLYVQHVCQRIPRIGIRSQVAGFRYKKRTVLRSESK